MAVREVLVDTGLGEGRRRMRVFRKPAFLSTTPDARFAAAAIGTDRLFL